MAKLTKLKRSNNAHKSLMKKYNSLVDKTPSYSRENLRSCVLADYHEECLKRQNEIKELLTFDERKKCFKRISKAYRYEE